MSYDKFRTLVKQYKKMKKEAKDTAAIGSTRQDDEFTIKALSLYDKLDALREQIEEEIASTDDPRIKNYFSAQSGVSL